MLSDNLLLTAYLFDPHEVNISCEDIIFAKNIRHLSDFEILNGKGDKVTNCEEATSANQVKFILSGNAV